MFSVVERGNIVNQVIYHLIVAQLCSNIQLCETIHGSLQSRSMLQCFAQGVIRFCITIYMSYTDHLWELYYILQIVVKSN